jgi:two-component system, NarL family, response regulator
MRILVVDDDPAVRKLVRFLLVDVAEVHECGDGADALSAYERYGPDWVLMDLSMSGVNGLPALRQILAAHPEARVAILTQYDSPILRVAAAQAGAHRYFLKDDLTQLRALFA